MLEKIKAMKKEDNDNVLKQVYITMDSSRNMLDKIREDKTI